MGVELPNRNTLSYNMADDDGDVSLSDRELVKHVRDALKSVQSGDMDKYNQLVAVIHTKETDYTYDEALLETSLKALSGTVSNIDFAHHEFLLSAVFGMSMWNYRPAVMDALVDLIISLAASNGNFVDSCLDMLVSNFKPPFYLLDKLNQDNVRRKKENVLSRVHRALKSIADLVPLSPLRLMLIVIQRMPTNYKKDYNIVEYVENMLKLESGELGELVGSTILMAVVDRLIDLDVEIGWDDILQDEPSNTSIFEMELEDMDEAADDDELSGCKFPGETLNRKSLGANIVAELLDNLMVRTFDHLESCKDAGRLIEVFETLLESFEITILTAYKSKFAQFVIFYACALDPENCGVKFPMMLSNLFVRDGRSELIRMSAVSYLASYLSRGRFLSTSFIVSMLKRLVDWCLEYSKFQGGDVNPKAHRVFYSGCQAIFYVLCFRMRSIMDVPRLKQLFLMPLEQILKHKLNPLLVCLPSVVAEFLRQAKAARLFTVSKAFIFDDLLESEHSREFGGLERLDMFFPFDPCLLKNSNSFIQPFFVFWSRVRTTYDNDEEVSSEEDDVDDFLNENAEDAIDDMMVRSSDERDLYLDEFDYALNKMSITPKYSFVGSQAEKPLRMPSRIRPSTSPESL
ncbi:RRN3 domain-containing protein [Cephalotus follicularis]|uniref:RRN3 domain-containing protein n=1 Tax=Cephalotus follicularis TaxID=3775 RepID=A0A1Q3D168_CEPFO|nr:RRN3 domain-containing protein [Cephalotus follicularis]